MANADPSRILPPQKTALPAPGLIGTKPRKGSRVKKEARENPVDFFAEFATLPVKEDENFDLMSDPQDQYDEDIQEYTSGEILGRPGEAMSDFDARFRNDFYRYSREYHDREGGAPGIDQDFGVPLSGAREDASARTRSDGSMDDRIREEILDLFTRDTSLVADDVTAQVEDGLVTLTGTALDSEMRSAIEDAVQSVPGVEGVENRLGLG